MSSVSVIFGQAGSVDNDIINQIDAFIEATEQDPGIVYLWDQVNDLLDKLEDEGPPKSHIALMLRSGNLAPLLAMAGDLGSFALDAFSALGDFAEILGPNAS